MSRTKLSTVIADCFAIRKLDRQKFDVVLSHDFPEPYLEDRTAPCNAMRAIRTQPVVSVAVIRNHDTGRVYIGVSRCSWLDHFSRPEAWKHAISRALNKVKTDGPFIQLIKPPSERGRTALAAL